MAGRRRTRVGTVLSDKADKTITVGVSWLQRDRIYRKKRRRLTRLAAHDEDNQAHTGDQVLVEESRPISRQKRWRLVDVLQRADLAEVKPVEIDPETAAAPDNEA